MDTYWHKQALGKPLFPDLMWSRPENKAYAGKLLIIGGNLHGFAAPAESYQAAERAGIGLSRVLLPDGVKKLAGPLLPGIEYAPSTPSGSFARSALADWLTQAAWADGTLLAGDLGHNSETAIVVESFLSKHKGQVTVTKDAADYCLALAGAVLERPDTLLIITMAQLQKLATNVKHDTAFTLGMDLIRLIDGLHSFSLRYPANIIVKHLDHLVVASGGQISTTKLTQDLLVWRVKTASAAAVWWLQNPSKTFEALTCAVSEANSFLH